CGLKSPPAFDSSTRLIRFYFFPFSCSRARESAVFVVLCSCARKSAVPFHCFLFSSPAQAFEICHLPLAICHLRLATSPWPLALNTTIALGTAALFLEPPNFSRPLSNRTSPRIANRCHHSVSVRAATRQTTVAPSCADSQAFRIHFPITAPYGGFINT